MKVKMEVRAMGMKIRGREIACLFGETIGPTLASGSLKWLSRASLNLHDNSLTLLMIILYPKLK